VQRPDYRYFSTPAISGISHPKRLSSSFTVHEFGLLMGVSQLGKLPVSRYEQHSNKHLRPLRYVKTQGRRSPCQEPATLPSFGSSVSSRYLNIQTTIEPPRMLACGLDRYHKIQSRHLRIAFIRFRADLCRRPFTRTVAINTFCLRDSSRSVSIIICTSPKLTRMQLQGLRILLSLGESPVQHGRWHIRTTSLLGYTYHITRRTE